MKKQLAKLAVVALIPIVIWNIPAPSGLKTETWHIVAIYLGLLAGLVIKPFKEPIITLIIIGFGSMFLDSTVLFAGYGDTMTWFICIVTIVATSFVKTGLGKRIAYNLLVRAGNSTLGLGYLLMVTDLILSPATGSNSARTTIIYPIFRQIAEGVGSTPTEHPKRLGAYLTILSYVTSQGTAALFLTGMATNAVTVSLVTEMMKIKLTWGTWFLASIVPAGLFLLVAPLIVYLLYKPELKTLEDVKPIAKEGLKKLGKITNKEKMLLVLFVLAILGWMLGSKITFLDLGMKIVGFVFLAAVLVTGILDWDDVIGAKGGWNIFVWYGAFFGVATALSNAGFYTWLADVLGEALHLTSVNGLLVTLILLLVSIAVRYFFVSNSAFVASFYPVLLTLALTTKANPMAISLLLAFFASYGALLTHYGNGAGLIVFASGYVPQKDFWKIGTCMVGVALVIFLLIGMPYWYLIGLC
ncbi:MAG: anion permease [Lachnospiraceae bacterium]|jgi:DASS family divalent anion:Na+ symporter|nr:anion permease [Lachnospiraceae bacterium]